MSHFSSSNKNQWYDERQRLHHNSQSSTPNFYQKEPTMAETNSYYGKQSRHSLKMVKEGEFSGKQNVRGSTSAPAKHRTYQNNADGPRRYNHSSGKSGNLAFEPGLDQTEQMRSGPMELDSLFGGNSGRVQVNAMNDPNNSTIQCGCENIDCPYCNIMTSIEMNQ